MCVLYEKPVLRSYSAGDIIEEIGPCQNQYTTVTLYTTTGNNAVNVDGYVSATGGGATYDNGIWVGAYPGGDYDRGLVGFDISGIHSTIVSATLKVYQQVCQDDPIGNLGPMLVDHIDFGSSMDDTDLTKLALTSNIGTISNSNTNEWKTLDVKNYVQADLDAGRTSSQFRLHFTTEASGGFDRHVQFEDAENTYGTGNRPPLVVTYY